MKYLKKYDKFNEDLMMAAEPATRPATRPGISPGTKPGITPGKPSPIRRDKPAVKPAPKAELPKASAEDVINKYAELTKQDI